MNIAYAEPSRKPVSFLNWEGSAGAFAQRTDWWSPFVILVLATWSVLAIYSTGSLKTPAFFAQEFASKQLSYVCIGWVAYWVISLLELRALERYAWVLYAAGVIPLLLVAACAVLKTDLGGLVAHRLGARRWIFLPGFSVQPSEFAKISTLVLLAFTVGRGVVFEGLSIWERWVVAVAGAIFRMPPWRRFCEPVNGHLPMIVRTTWITALPFALIFVQPDLGSALLYVPMVFALQLVANVPLRFFAILALLALPGAVVLTVDMSQYGAALRQYQENPPEGASLRDPALGIRETFQGILPLRNYHRERIMTLVNPRLIDPNGEGKDWQPRQARMAIARGGLWGQGFQNGTLVRLGWLPEMAAHNDFIFASICEEAGFVGGAAILCLFGALAVFALTAAARAPDKFHAALAAGVAVILVSHVLVNVGMNVGIMPVTGISLPFLSYGGSFILSCFLLFGIAQSVHRSGRPLAPSGAEGDGDFQTSSQLPRVGTTHASRTSSTPT
ncbi:MAG: rod shape-determining protein RodA [Puniceicoccales bacterium]|jgi:rod shape determining protein RodA|nr:rod shape-determining protein RodA [Puniceicoccales bacterium]